jgi:hypothetical protein
MWGDRRKFLINNKEEFGFYKFRLVFQSTRFLLDLLLRKRLNHFNEIDESLRIMVAERFCIYLHIDVIDKVNYYFDI